MFRLRSGSFLRYCLSPITLAAALAAGPGLRAEEPGWKLLSDRLDASVWKTPTGAWYIAGNSQLDPANERRLIGVPGEGVLVNGPTGRTSNLTSRENFGDLELHCEFLVPKGSNSGVKFLGLYEIQILDSYGVATPKAQDCGGIYPRAELLPRYHYLDEGHPPRVNASRPPGEWQTLDATFRAPRIDPDGTKTRNARLEKVVLNGQVIHENLELATPTGHAWSRKEPARGPLLIQADHGPVAFRNFKVRPLPATD